MAAKRKAFITKRIVKSKQHIPLSDLPDSPVSVLKGVGAKAAENLYESFYVDTIRDLADLKFAVWSQELLALEKVPQEKIDMHSFASKLIKEFEATPVKELLDSPIYVLQGVSEGDEERMRELGVKTVREFAKLKYVTWAQEIMREVYGDMSVPAKPASHEQSPQEALIQPVNQDSAPVNAQRSGASPWKTIAVVLLIFLLVGLVYFGAKELGFFSKKDKTAKGAEQALPEGLGQAKVDSEAKPGQPVDIQEKSAVTPSLQPSEPEAVTPDPEAPSGSDDSGLGSPGSPNDTTEGTSVLTSAQPGAQYTVQDGDTLFAISRQAYGHAKHWKKIYKANASQISNPNWILKGQVLTIPKL